MPQLPDADAKKAARQAFATDTMPRWLTLLEDRLGAGPYYGGASLMRLHVYRREHRLWW